MIKRALISIAVILVIIQFVHPGRNANAEIGPNDITKVYVVPDNVLEILHRACYDCHSNSTTYPWYSKIQPVDWLLTHHINEGKQHFNFAEIGSYPKAKQAKKLHEVAKTIPEGEMPLDSYLWIHKNAILTDAEKKVMEDWAEGLSRQAGVPVQ